MNNTEPDIPSVETLGELQHVVHGWITTVGHGYFSPLTNAVILAEETGEVARVMARTYGDQKPKPGDKTGTDALADELADLVWVVAAIANQTGVDLTEAVRKNIVKKYTRDRRRFEPPAGTREEI